MFRAFDRGNHLYNLHEWQRAAVAPLQILAHVGKRYHLSPLNPMSYTSLGRSFGAACELLERMTKRYSKPQFGFEHTVVNGRRVKVSEEVYLDDPFCNLLHFKRGGSATKGQPTILIVAPLSGHYATLLRGTAEALLPHAEVYITDWINASEVPLDEGEFTLDDYIDYVKRYLHFLGPETHVVAVCQPSVPVLAAVSLMSAEDVESAPASMTLMGGPIDTRINPTEVNQLAEQKPIEWFEQNVISRVPMNYPGFMRKVYPGFLQLTGFMSMNLDRHIGEHIKLFQHLVDGDGESAEAHRTFYNEYLSVMDLPAEFYLQTVKTVFQKHSLPKGTMKSRGKKVDTAAIKKTALLCIEGERDDISGVGQTRAAMTICSGLSASKKKYYLQMGVGHYGIFNGRRYRDDIVPIMLDFMKTHAATKKAGK